MLRINGIRQSTIWKHTWSAYVAVKTPMVRIVVLLRVICEPKGCRRIVVKVSPAES